MSGSDPAAVLPVRHALDEFSTALDHLIKLVDDGSLEDLDADELIGFAQELEQVRNRIPLIDHRLIAAGTVVDVPGHLCQRSMTRVLAAALRISAGEAHRRVRAAEQLGPRHTMTGEPLEPWRPALADAQRAGQIGPEQVTVIDTALRKVDGPGFDPADVDAGERLLVDAALAMGPEDLRQIAMQLVDAIDPDGTVPDDEHQQARRFLLFKPAKDGSFRGEFRLTPQVGQKLKAVLDSLAAPISTRYMVVAESDDGARPLVEPDLRTRPQRLHDALGLVCDRILRSGTLPDTGGIPTTVIVTIDAGLATALWSQLCRLPSWPIRPVSPGACAASAGRYSAWGGRGGSPHLPKRWPSSPATPAARFLAVPPTLHGANATTSCPGSKAVRPT
jgi:hypothetical protein